VREYRSLKELGEHVLSDWHGVLSTLSGIEKIPRTPFIATQETNHVWRRLSQHALGAKDAVDELLRSASLTEHNPEYPKSKVDFFSEPPAPAGLNTANGGDGNKSIMVISGPSGVGKTSLLQDWAEDFNAGSPRVPMIYFRIGETQDSGMLHTLLQECIEVGP